MTTDRKEQMAQAMSQRLEKTQVYQSKVQPWRRDALAMETGSRCGYCGTPLLIPGKEAKEGAQPVDLDHFIALNQGGTDQTKNLVVCCERCKEENLNGDWLAYGKAVNPKLMIAKREMALRTSAFNHLTKGIDDRKNSMRLEREMANRWMNPRFTCFAWCGPEFGAFGFKRPSHAPEVAMGIMKGIGEAEVFQFATGGRLVAIVERSKFLDVAWELIDFHGYLKKVGPDGMLDFTPGNDANLARWGEVFVGMDNLQRGQWADSSRANAEFASWKREKTKGAKRLAYKENYVINRHVSNTKSPAHKGGDL